MSHRTYGYKWCYVCGKDVSSGGLGWFQHCRKHVRSGQMVEEKRRDAHNHSYYDFKPTVGTILIAPPKRNTKP